MDHATRLIEARFAVRDGALCVDGVPVGELAARHGTPCYVYSRNVLDSTLARLRAALPARFDLYYSVKANPNRAFLRYFLAAGCGLEVASAGELRQALAAGAPPKRILFAGPGKTEAELSLALSSGIGEIHVESRLEIERLADMSPETGPPARIALRINPEGSVQGGAMRMGGQPSPFGIDEEALDDAVELVQSRPSLALTGVHLFVGTQILDYERLIEQYRHGIEIARRVARKTGAALDTVDLGGGFGIPYFARERELDLDGLHDGLRELMEEVDSDPTFKGTRFVVEPGRFLVGEAGVYVTRINDVKVSRSKRFLVVDGGMHHHLAASGNLGQTIKRNYPIAMLGKIGQPVAESVDVVGPLCTPLDVLGRGVQLPRAAVGDLIGVFQSGAYARTASPLGFLSHPGPPEIWVENGRDRLIRRRGSDEEPLRDQCDPGERGET